MLEDGAGIRGVHSWDRAHKPGPAPAAALTSAPFLPTCPGLPATRLGASAHPQPAPQMPGAATCPDLPRALLGPFFLLSPQPRSLSFPSLSSTLLPPAWPLQLLP